jgi:hypothetical protein
MPGGIIPALWSRDLEDLGELRLESRRLERGALALLVR